MQTQIKGIQVMKFTFFVEVWLIPRHSLPSPRGSRWLDAGVSRLQSVLTVPVHVHLVLG